ncbi:hypothetical protein EVA_17828 [gut metagenome]|uniref:Uncharacterized protein n=1 Tax=gut metagenome TaxID=749906 RepID=J9G3H0_9ZZZZ
MPRVSLNAQQQIANNKYVMTNPAHTSLKKCAPKTIRLINVATDRTKATNMLK